MAANPHPVQVDVIGRAVEAPLTFFVPDGIRPRVFQATPEHPEVRRTGAFASTVVPIRDSRGDPHPMALDEAGFELIHHHSAVTDFLDNEQVRRHYYPEVEALLREATGASEVVIFDHTVRIEDKQKSQAHNTRAPVPTVHNDYTLKSGPQRIEDLLDPDDAASWRERRFAVVNVWRSIAGPVETMPLAIADARSISSDDFIATDLVYPDRVGEIYQVRYNPAQRWHYFSNMTRDEVMLIKVFDSDDSKAKWTAHSAFTNPQAKADAPPRESIEVRTLLSFS